MAVVKTWTRPDWWRMLDRDVETRWLRFWRRWKAVLLTLGEGSSIMFSRAGARRKMCCSIVDFRVSGGSDS